MYINRTLDNPTRKLPTDSSDNLQCAPELRGYFYNWE